jgi:outer membrane receptor protein involved in Fe transport
MKSLLAVLMLSGTLAPTASADQSASLGRIYGRVLDSQGLPAPGFEVRLEAGGVVRTALSDAPDGAFKFEDVPAGRARLTGWMSGRQQGTAREVIVEPGRVVEIALTVRLGFQDEVTVTGSREEQLKRETAATVDVVSQETIDLLKPTHPGQIMGLVPGVWVNVTGGEGHQTAIRQPLTTNPVYLYLEDGVPSRSTGFFNHNALYEINVPQAEGIEVTKGPGSALYGSDAIGGVVNVLTRSALTASGGDVSAEGGAYGFGRLLASANGRRGESGLRADVNLTRTDGWRDATGYERQSFSLRGDRATSGGSHLKLLATYSHIDQETAGSSALPEAEYEDNPTYNLTPISYRKVEAFRLSADYSRPLSGGELSLIPYFRYDTMGLLPNWTLTFDPTYYDTRNTSYGLLAKMRRDFAPWRMQWIGGVDLDLSPGMREETRIAPGTTPIPGGPNAFTSFTDVGLVYDYDVTYFGAAPYLNVEVSPWPSVRASAGLRLDHVRYDYDDKLTTPETPRHQRPADTTRDYDHLSPKFGVTWQVTSQVNAFASYRHAFRVPSEGQLFRQGSALNTIDLQPVKAENLEAGLRVTPRRSIALEASVYRLDKKDDILSFRDPVDGSTQAVNAGHTRHVGVEAGARLRPLNWLEVSAAYSWARHTYEDWVVDPARGLDFSGNEMEIAPDQIGNLLVSVTPKNGAFSVELVHLGEYWMDAANTHEYPGHTLINLRAQYSVTRRLQAFARLLNAADERYAESASYTQARGEEFAPGMPRTAYFGMKVAWGR